MDTNTLYTDGALYATAIDGLNAESDSSNVCTIDCILPQSNLSITATDTVICQVIDSASIDVINSQSGIIYEAYDAIGDSAIGTSVLGTGSTITLFTFPLVVSPSKISARAFKISPVLCEVVLTDTATFIIDPLPDTALVVTPADTVICSGQSYDISVLISEIGVNYQLKDSGSNALIGSIVQGTGGTIALSTGALNAASTFIVSATDTTGVSDCSIDLTAKSSVDLQGADLSLSMTTSDSVICGGDSAILSIQTENNASVSYQVKRLSNNSNIGAAFVGNGTVFTRSTGSVSVNDTFFVEVTAGSCVATLLDSIFIEANISPTSMDDGLFSVSHGDALLIDILNNDNDANGDSLLISIIVNPYQWFSECSE